MLKRISNFVKRNLCKVSYEYFTPNKNRIEIEITTACNLYCINCGRACSPIHSVQGIVRLINFNALRL